MLGGMTDSELGQRISAAPLPQQPQPPYGAPAPPAHAPAAGSQRGAVASLSLGIAGLAVAWIPILNFVTGAGAVVGIVLGTKAIRAKAAGVKLAIWGVVLSGAALVGTLLFTALLVLVFTGAADREVLSTMKSDATRYAVGAQARYVESLEYPASVTIPPGTASPDFAGQAPSGNTISFQNNGDSFVITVTNPDAVPDETVVYDSLGGGLVAP